MGICTLIRKLGIKGKYLEIDVTAYGMYRLWLDKTRRKFYSFPTADINTFCYITLPQSLIASQADP